SSIRSVQLRMNRQNCSCKCLIELLKNALSVTAIDGIIKSIRIIIKASGTTIGKSIIPLYFERNQIVTPIEFYLIKVIISTVNYIFQRSEERRVVKECRSRWW